MPVVEVDYMHICDYAFPAQGGKACIIGIFDRIHATSFPTVHPQMSVAIHLRGQQGEAFQLKVELVKPDGDILATANAHSTISVGGGGFVHLLMMQINFPTPGDYTFRVSADDRLLVTQTLFLLRRDAPQQHETRH